MLNAIKYFTNISLRLIIVCLIITFPALLSVYFNNINILFGMILTIPFGYYISNKITI